MWSLLVITGIIFQTVLAVFLLNGVRRDDDIDKHLRAMLVILLVLGISTGLLLAILHFTAVKIPGFDLRLLPYICYSAIPALILRYRLQKRPEKKEVEPAPAAQGLASAAWPIPAAVAGSTPAAQAAVVVAMAAEEPAGNGNTPDRRYEKSGMDAGRMDEYEASLAAFMQKSRIYLDPDLSLEGLASRMKMSRHHLTQLLNERIAKNFYSYINEYRIAEAIDRLNDPSSQVNILSLAFDCGFNSRSSFNNYFKKITGSTPTTYRKQLLEQAAAQRLSRLIPDTSTLV